MGDFCLLAASLIAQEKLSGWQLTVPRSVPSEMTNSLETNQPPCPASVPQSIAKAEVHHPEFSQSKLTIPSKTAKVGVAEIRQPFPAGARPEGDSLGSASFENEAEANEATAAIPLSAAPSPELSQPSAPSAPSAPVRLPPASSVMPPELAPTQPPLPGEPYQETSVVLPPSYSSQQWTFGPTTGSQLYYQRWAALRSGRLYTRLPANSYQDLWINATDQPTYQQWLRLLDQEASVMARAQGSNRLTVLLGDSLSLWLPIEQLPRDRFWLNQGISGDTTTGVLRRLSTFSDTMPDAIHVMIGINDLRQGMPDEAVLNNMRQIMRQLRQAHPNAQVLMYSILPTRLVAIPSERIRSLNQRIASIAQQERVNFFDLQTYFTDAQGHLRQDLTTDGLHLNPNGYAVWHWAMQLHS